MHSIKGLFCNKQKVAMKTHWTGIAVEGGVLQLVYMVATHWMPQYC